MGWQNDLKIKEILIDWSKQNRWHGKIEIGMPFSLMRVTPESPNTVQKAVYEIAGYFRREFNYDFRQFVPGEGIWFDAYLICNGYSYNNHQILGALCFRKRDDGIVLQWLWLHPFYRHHSFLKLAWPHLIEMYPGFIPEPPYSKAMDSFLRKYYPDQHVYLRSNSDGQ